MIARYREAHDRYHSWPEIRAGILEVGILEMEIYILGNRLFMIDGCIDAFTMQAEASDTSGYTFPIEEEFGYN